MAAAFVKDGDRLDYGVKGMKWGQSKFDNSLGSSNKSPAGQKAQAAAMGKMVKDVLPKMASKLEYNGLDFNDPKNSAMRDKYGKDLEKAYEDLYHSRLRRERVKATLKWGNAAAAATFVVVRQGAELLQAIDGPTPDMVVLKLKLDEKGHVIDVDDPQIQHQDDVPDYVGALFVKDGDKLDYGVKGMKWGRRKSEGTSAVGSSSPATETKKVVGAASGETSQARYARLAAQAKAGQASSFDQQDLAFFNARTEAIAKVNKMNATKPGWLGETSKKVLLGATEKAMSDVANGVAKKYLSEKLLAGLPQQPGPSLAERSAKAVREAIDKKAIDDAVAKALAAQP